MKAKYESQEDGNLLDDEQLNLDEFPEELPDLLGLSPAEEDTPAPPADEAAEDIPEEAEAEDEDEAAPEPAQTEPHGRMVGWVYKKAPGKAPEVQVVEAPVPETEPEDTDEAPEDTSPDAPEPAVSPSPDTNREEDDEDEESPEETDEPDEIDSSEDEDDDEDDDDILPVWGGSSSARRQTRRAASSSEGFDTDEDEEESAPTPTWGDVFRRMLGRRKKKSAEAQDERPQLYLVEDDDEEDDNEWGQEVEEPQKARKPFSLFRRPPMPDLSPRQLVVLYGNRMKSLKRGLLISLPVCVLLVYLNLSDSLNLPVPTFLWDNSLLSAAMLELLGLEVLLLCRPFIRGFADLFRGKPGMHTMSSLAVLLTALDCGVELLIGREGPLPCASAAGIILLCSSAGQYLNQRAQRVACRTAAMTDNPGRLTLLREGGQTTDMLLKYKGDTSLFGSQIQESDGVQRRTGPLSLVLMIAGVMLAILASVGQGEVELVFWCASVIFTLAAPLSATLAYAMPWSRVADRLNRVGGALAGWDGVLELKDANQIAITDDDLFPTGMISCNGIQLYGNVRSGYAVGYTATLVKATGGGLVDTFDKLVYSQGARYWTAMLTGYIAYEGGGCGGYIGKDEVLVGSAEFMELMDIPLPEGISVKTATFCAINGELAAQFALIYKMPGYVQPAVQALLQAKYQIAMAVRDFNLTPQLLTRSFGLPMQKLAYPDTDTRVELATPPDEEDMVLGALLSREGLDSHCDTVLGAKALYKVGRKNANWVAAASIVGLLLGAYLTAARAYIALQPLNILIFMGLWLVPCLLNVHKVDQF
ncbi:MAG: hypothetical protein LUD79_06995 [Oscillospiraceae bacterium]|nr:hypothetical protein [Oscillospiraceae bacterium]